MQSSLKSAVILFFLSAGVFGWSLTGGAPETEPISAASSNIREIYVNNCARCHGGDGKSQTQLGTLYGSPDLTSRATKRKSSKTLARVIRNGGGSMPAFGKKLSAKEITQMVAYVRSLK